MSQLASKAAAMAELFAVLEGLSIGEVAMVAAYARDLQSGDSRIEPADATGPIRPLSEADTPNAALFNSILGFTTDGRRLSGRE